METNQEKAKEILGEANYKRLLAGGFLPVEVNVLEVFVNHHSELEKLQNRLKELELILRADSPAPSPTPLKEKYPDMDYNADIKRSVRKKPVPEGYELRQDIAFQALEDEVMALNKKRAKLNFSVYSASGRNIHDQWIYGTLNVTFLAKGNQQLINDLKALDWKIGRWRIDDEDAPTGKAVMIKAEKSIQLQYKMGYEAKRGEIR